MATPTFSPPQAPSFTVPVSLRAPATRRGGRPGLSITTRQGIYQARTVELTWRVMLAATREYIESFFHGLEGGLGPFYWTPIDPEPSPTGSDLEIDDDTVSGSLGARTYEVSITWRQVDGLLETLEGKVHTFAAQANRVVTVKAPPIPLVASEWAVYAGEPPAARTQQAIITGTRTWTEPDTGLVSGSALPTVNDLRYPRLWEYSGEANLDLIRPGRWSGSIILHELFF